MALSYLIILYLIAYLFIAIMSTTQNDTITELLQLHSKLQEAEAIGISKEALNDIQTAAETSAESCHFISELTNSVIKLIESRVAFDAAENTCAAGVIAEAKHKCWKEKTKIIKGKILESLNDGGDWVNFPPNCPNCKSPYSQHEVIDIDTDEEKECEKCNSKEYYTFTFVKRYTRSNAPQCKAIIGTYCTECNNITKDNSNDGEDA